MSSKKKKKEEKNKSYTRDNRPKGVSKNEWDKARKAEGRDPYAKFFSDPAKDRRSSSSSSSKSSVGKWDSNKESYNDYQKRLKGETTQPNYVQNQQGQGFSMAPEKVDAFNLSQEEKDKADAFLNAYLQNPYQATQTQALQENQGVSQANPVDQMFTQKPAEAYKQVSKLQPKKQEEADSFIEKLKWGLQNKKAVAKEIPQT